MKTATAKRTKKTGTPNATTRKVIRQASAIRPLPTIAAAFEDGIYAGIARGENGEKDHYLIVLAEAPGRLTWKSAMDWAKKLGGDLPTRREQAVLYGNVPELFQTTWYWSSTQYAGYAAYAWSQGFTTGNQDGLHKGGELRARAVRRLAIQ